MDDEKLVIETITIVLASLILAVVVSFSQFSLTPYAIISFLIIISSNVLAKKIAGYFFETKINIKFWSLYQFGFRKDAHFKKPLPMAWLPLLLALLTKGSFWWLLILVFDVSVKAERVARRHGLYRFTQITEWHLLWIAVWGVITNILLSIIGYIAGFEFFAKLSIAYAFWSIIPISNSDGSKILFGNRIIWMTLSIILAVLLFWSFSFI